MSKIETTIKLSVMFFILFPIWLVLSLPFIGLLFFSGKIMFRKQLVSMLSKIVFASISTILLAPVPTPIITVFVPHIFIGGNPWPPTGEVYYSQVIHWYVISAFVTWIVSFLLIQRYFNKSLE